ncbi:HD domain-containing protein [Planctomycetota bacterium]
MQQKQVENFKIFFDDYVASFYGDDEFVNANIKLKDDHSRRVCEEMAYLADELNLSPNEKLIAETIALLHDIGRFEQFIRYRTYHDPKSVNHCLLGLEVLRNTKILDDINGQEREIIERAIELHGVRELPTELDGDCLLFSQLIRDADKIDIYYIVIDYYRQYQQNPDAFKLEVELPDIPEYSDDLIEKLLNSQRIDYHTLRTWNDMKLCQLSWVYDVNFSQTLRRIKKRRFLEGILEFLPQTADIEKVRRKIFEYVDARIKKGA